MIEGDRARERDESEDKGKREERQAEDNREKKSEIEMMREIVGGIRRMLSPLQVSIEDMAAAVVSTANSLALR